MRDLNERLLTHLFIECSLIHTTGDEMSFINEGRNVILEKHGVIPELERYWKIFINNILHVKPNDNNDYIINNDIFNEISGNIFTNVFIKIHHNITNSNKIECKGRYIPSFNDELINDKLPLKIELTFTAYSIHMISCIKSIFMHELTHAYENYMRIKKSGKNIFHHLNKTNYKKIRGEFMKNNGSFTPIINNICYLFSPTESKAYISTIKEELENMIDDNCTCTNDVMNIIKKTFTWNKIHESENALYYLLNINDTITQYIILNEWSETTGENIKTYNALKRILKNRYLKNCNHMLSQISKIAFDIYCEKGQQYMNETFL